MSEPYRLTPLGRFSIWFIYWVMRLTIVPSLHIVLLGLAVSWLLIAINDGDKPYLAGLVVFELATTLVIVIRIKPKADEVIQHPFWRPAKNPPHWG